MNGMIMDKKADVLSSKYSGKMNELFPNFQWKTFTPALLDTADMRGGVSHAGILTL